MHYQLCVHMCIISLWEAKFIAKQLFGGKLLLYYGVSISNSQVFKEKLKKSILETKAFLRAAIYEKQDIKSLSLSCQRSKMGTKQFYFKAHLRICKKTCKVVLMPRLIHGRHSVNYS